MPTKRRHSPHLVLAVALLLPACSDEQGELGVALTGSPSAIPFSSHNILIGWFLQIQVAIDERGGVPVELDRVQVAALDRGTSQVFGPSVMSKEDLDLAGFSSLPAHGHIVLQPPINFVRNRPTGPIAVRVDVHGVDAEGRVVSAVLSGDYPLAP